MCIILFCSMGRAMEPGYANKDYYGGDLPPPYTFDPNVDPPRVDNVRTSQPEATRTQAHSTESRNKDDDKDNCCVRCCHSTHKCMMSGECGRALQIANVVAMCGMCLRWFICKFHFENLCTHRHYITELPNILY